MEVCHRRGGSPDRTPDAHGTHGGRPVARRSGPPDRPVPVVVNLHLTCCIQVSGDGRNTVDVEQSLQDDLEAGGTFGLVRCWTPVSSSDMTSTAVHTSVTTAGSRRAALGAQATVGLYGSAGVVADLAPCVRGEGTGTVTGTRCSMPTFPGPCTAVST